MVFWKLIRGQSFHALSWNQCRSCIIGVLLREESPHRHRTLTYPQQFQAPSQHKSCKLSSFCKTWWKYNSSLIPQAGSTITCWQYLHVLLFPLCRNLVSQVDGCEPVYKPNTFSRILSSSLCIDIYWKRHIAKENESGLLREERVMKEN